MTNYTKTARPTSQDSLRTLAKPLHEDTVSRLLANINYNELELRVLSQLGRNTSFMKSFRKMYGSKK
jgi:hypothetical protein